MNVARALATLMVFAPLSSALAAEVDFEGFYRARGRMFDSLTLQRDNLANGEGRVAYAQHRLWLRPSFILSENVVLRTEIRGLDGVLWGDEPVPGFDPVTGVNESTALSDSMEAPSVALTTGERATAAGTDITLWRAWGEVHTPYGRFMAGRMPLNWGSGVWQNDGTSGDMMDKDFGDTADRVAWEHLIDDKVYLLAAVDLNSEGYLNLADDMASLNLGAAYRSETVVAGLNGQYRSNSSTNLGLFTISGAVDAELGSIELHTEIVGQFGSGSLDAETGDVQIGAGGGVLDLAMKGEKLDLGALAGFATGDGNSADANMHTFTFDRDYNIGLFMFEQPMPVLSTNGTGSGRSYGVTQTGEAISNAIFLKPRVAYHLRDDLTLNAAALFARAATAPDGQDTRKSYGYEVTGGLTYEPYEHVELNGTAGVFLPRSWYSEYDTENFDFSATAYGAQLGAIIRF